MHMRLASDDVNIILQSDWSSKIPAHKIIINSCVTRLFSRGTCDKRLGTRLVGGGGRGEREKKREKLTYGTTVHSHSHRR